MSLDSVSVISLLEMKAVKWGKFVSYHDYVGARGDFSSSNNTTGVLRIQHYVRTSKIFHQAAL